VKVALHCGDTVYLQHGGLTVVDRTTLRSPRVYIHSRNSCCVKIEKSPKEISCQMGKQKKLHYTTTEITNAIRLYNF